jgi:hypothetical protein
MKKLLFQSGVLLLLLALLSTGQAQGQFQPAFCDQGHSIQDAVDRAKDGAFIEVFGTCNETVRITKDDIQIVGRNGATIMAPTGSFAAFDIVGANRVVISDLNIHADDIAIHVAVGSNATFLRNHFENYSLGIAVVGNSTVSISDNTLHSTNSGNVAIIVTEASFGGIFGNTITAGSGDGILTLHASHALLSCNDVSSDGIGILVGSNSSLHLRGDCLNTVNNSVGEAFHCSPSGSVVAVINQILNGTVILEAGCDIERGPGVTIP